MPFVAALMVLSPWWLLTVVFEASSEGVGLLFQGLGLYPEAP